MTSEMTCIDVIYSHIACNGCHVSVGIGESSVVAEIIHEIFTLRTHSTAIILTAAGKNAADRLAEQESSLSSSPLVLFSYRQNRKVN